MNQTVKRNVKGRQDCRRGGDKKASADTMGEGGDIRPQKIDQHGKRTILKNFVDKKQKLNYLSLNCSKMGIPNFKKVNRNYECMTDQL